VDNSYEWQELLPSFGIILNVVMLLMNKIQTLQITATYFQCFPQHSLPIDFFIEYINGNTSLYHVDQSIYFSMLKFTFSEYISISNFDIHQTPLVFV